MTPAEIAELAIDISNRVDMQWGLFVTVHMAVIGAIVYLDKPMLKVEKAIALSVYFGFMSINYSMMHTQLGLLNAAYLDVAQAAASGVDSNLIAKMAADQAAGRFEYGMAAIGISHTVMAVLVSLVVIYDKALSVKATTQKD